MSSPKCETMMVDWEERINFERMRRERMERARKSLKKFDFDALIAFSPDNIKYITGTFANNGTRLLGAYTILPKDDDPILFETGGDYPRQKLTASWMSDRVFPAVPLRIAPPELIKEWAEMVKTKLKELGVADGKICVDQEPHFGSRGSRVINALVEAGLSITIAEEVMTEARIIKTKDEIECIKTAVSLGEVAFEIARNAIKPGVTEGFVQAEMTSFLLQMNCLISGIGPCVSGEHTNPYLRRYTGDRIMRDGDLVIIDRVHEWNGYWSDHVRTFLCGTRATEEQKMLYKECYDHLYSIIKVIRPGATTADIGEKLKDAEDFSDFTLNFAHGTGIAVWEPPIVSCLSKKNPIKIRPNMVMSAETYASRPGGRHGVRLEEQLVVTETGCEIISLARHDERLME